MPGPELPRGPDRAYDIDAGGAAEDQALFGDQAEQHRQHLLVRHLEPAVDRRALEVLGEAALADALGDRVPRGLELTSGVVAVDRGAHGVREIDPRPGIAAL